MSRFRRPRITAALAWLATALLALTGCTPAPGPAGSGILPAATTMGPVHLRVNDLTLVSGFYRDVIGLQLVADDDDSVTLGLPEPLLTLETSASSADDPRQAGLYHSAILYDDEATLAATLLRVAQEAPESYSGSADHAVSLAFYLTDPEGNGVELYVDRPADEWQWDGGHVVMGSEPLDPNAFIEAHLGQPAAKTASMGHVHLRVGDTAEATDFYAGVLGFDVTAETQGAVFFSADGYHHHLATNTWSSAGAGQRPDSAGLAQVRISLPTPRDVDAVAQRLEAAGVQFLLTDDGLAVDDPWGTTLVLDAPDGPAADEAEA